MYKELQTVTTNLSKTHQLGEQIGKNLKGDEIFALVSELGGGKTSFTQGLAQGLGVTGNVISPTFVLERIYQTKGGFSLHHFDLYRIGAKDIDSIGLLDALGEGIVVIEWAEKIKKYLPAGTIWVEIDPSTTLGMTNKRKFTFKFPVDKSYAFAKVK